MFLNCKLALKNFAFHIFRICQKSLLKSRCKSTLDSAGIFIFQIPVWGVESRFFCAAPFVPFAAPVVGTGPFATLPDRGSVVRM